MTCFLDFLHCYQAPARLVNAAHPCASPFPPNGWISSWTRLNFLLYVQEDMICVQIILTDTDHKADFHEAEPYHHSLDAARQTPKPQIPLREGVFSLITPLWHRTPALLIKRGREHNSTRSRSHQVHEEVSERLEMSEIERRGGKSLLSSRSCEAEIPPGLQSPPKPSPGLRRHQAPQSGHSSPGPFPALRQEATGQPGSRDDLRLGGRGQGAGGGGENKTAPNESPREKWLFGAPQRRSAGQNSQEGGAGSPARLAACPPVLRPRTHTHTAPPRRRNKTRPRPGRWRPRAPRPAPSGSTWGRGTAPSSPGGRRRRHRRRRCTGGGCSNCRRCGAGPGRRGQALGGPQWAGDGRPRARHHLLLLVLLLLPLGGGARTARFGTASCRVHGAVPARQPPAAVTAQRGTSLWPSGSAGPVPSQLLRTAASPGRALREAELCGAPLYNINIALLLNPKHNAIQLPGRTWTPSQGGALPRPQATAPFPPAVPSRPLPRRSGTTWRRPRCSTALWGAGGPAARGWVRQVPHGVGSAESKKWANNNLQS